MAGKFITLYGINNIGKSTHAKLLVKNLGKAGYKAKYVKYPVYDIVPSGKFLNNILRGSSKQKISEDELQLWFVINRYQFQPELKKLLAENYIVVAEDYTGTGIAWGMAKGLSRDWLEETNKYLIKEDLAILLEGKRDLRAKEKNHVHEQNEELIKKCIKNHSDLADQLDWKRIKMQPKIEETAKILGEIVNKFLH